MAEIDIDKLLAVLPRLIRENDTVKGAIITALSGVVATRDDIQDLLREMDRRFSRLGKDLAVVQATLLSMQNKSGPGLENLVLDVMRETLLLEQVDPDKIRRQDLVDQDGQVFPPHYSTDVDVLVENGNTYLVEVKATADNRDIHHFRDVARLYQHLTGRVPAALILVALRISHRHRTLAEKTYGMRVIAGDIMPG